jgi:L-malate glycosyltransferase
MSPQPRILHIFSTFDPGGTETRTIKLIGAFGQDYKHNIWTGVPNPSDARQNMQHLSDVTFADEAAALLLGRPGLWRYYQLAKAMRGHSLILTYSWGAIDAVMAHRIFGGVLGLPALIHHEDGFDEDVATLRNSLKTLFRRFALRTAHAVVVPSLLLVDIARQRWHIPDKRLVRIGNGVNIGAFSNITSARNDVVVVGTVAGLRVVKNLPRLLRAVAAAGRDIRLAIIGDGPERHTIIAEAKRLGMADRLDLHGFQSDVAPYLAGFDIFALSSDSEQYPIALAEAMAAGLPVIATDVGDIRNMVAAANRDYIIPRDDEASFAAALQKMIDDVALRKKLGQANRQRAIDAFQESDMIAAYRKLYDGAIVAAER